MTLAEFIARYRIDHRGGGTHRHVRHGWIGVNPCPKCSSRSFHAGLTEDCSRAACWRCGGLSPWDLLGQAAGIPWWDARESITPPGGPLASPLTPSKPRGPVLYPPGLQALRRPHRAFLENRRFDPDAIADLWGVRATGPAGRLAWRLWIPIHLDGEVVSWTTRAVGDRQPRYVSASPEEESEDHKTLLYGEDLAGHAVVVVEGPTDVWRIGPGAVAVLGLQTSPQQIDRLGRFPFRAICFDREPAARRRAERLADLLQQLPGVTDTIELETGSDPGDCDQDEIDEIRRIYLED